MINRLYFPISKDDDVKLSTVDLERMGKNAVPTMAGDGYSATILGNGWHIFQQDPEIYKKDITENLIMVNARTGQQIQVTLDIKTPIPRSMIDVMPEFDTFSSTMEQVFTCNEDGYMLNWQGLTIDTVDLGDKYHYMRIADKMFSAEAIRRLSQERDIRMSTGTGASSYTRYPEMAEECKLLIAAYDATIKTLKGVE